MQYWTIMQNLCNCDDLRQNQYASVDWPESSICPSVWSFVRYQACEHNTVFYERTNRFCCKLAQWFTGKGVKQSTSGVRRSSQRTKLLDDAVRCGGLTGSNRFLPRHAMHKCGLCGVSVSVSVSITFVDHVKTNNVSSKFFHCWIAKPF